MSASGCVCAVVSGCYCHALFRASLTAAWAADCRTSDLGNMRGRPSCDLWNIGCILSQNLTGLACFEVAADLPHAEQCAKVAADQLPWVHLPPQLLDCQVPFSAVIMHQVSIPLQHCAMLVSYPDHNSSPCKPRRIIIFVSYFQFSGSAARLHNGCCAYSTRQPSLRSLQDVHKSEVSRKCTFAISPPWIRVSPPASIHQYDIRW